MARTQENSIVRGDSRQLESLLSPASADLIITGPPYFNEVIYSDDPGQLSKMNDYALFLQELGKVWNGCAEILKPGGVLAIWAHDFFRATADTNGRSYIPFHTDMLKHIPDSLIVRTITVWNRYLPKYHEPIPAKGPLGTRVQYLVVLQKKGLHTQNQDLIEKSLANHFWNPVWEHKTNPSLFGSQRLFRIVHATPTPLKKLFARLVRRLEAAAVLRDTHAFEFYHTECPPEIAERCIKDFSRPGDMVVDPFVGSGTSLLTAQKLGRRSIGIDINAEAVRVTAKRFGTKFGSDKSTG